MTWETVPLGEVADLRAGAAFPLAFQGRTAGQYPFAKVGDIGEASRSNSGDLSTARNYVDEADLVALRTRPIPALSTLFAKIGESLRLNARAFNGVPVLIDNNAMAAVPGRDVDPRFLFRFLQQIDLGQIASTTSVPSLRKTDLARWPVPLPPLREQRRIAATLDEADALRSTARSSLSTADTLIAATFTSMFGSPETWDSKPLAHVARLHSGGTPSKSKPELWDGDVPWFSPKDMKSPSLYDSTDHVTLEATAAGKLKLLPADTVTVVVRGMILAHTLPVTRLRVPGTINQDVKALLPRVETDAAFLASAIRAQSKRILGEVAASGHGTKRLDTTVLASLPIPQASRHHQLGFRRAVDSIEGHLDRGADRVARLDALFASLQYRAFRGEL